MLRNIVIALLLAVSSAERLPSFKLNLNQHKLGAIPSRENLSGECQVESQLTNQLAAGANVALGTNKDSIFVRSLFGRASDICFGGRKLNGNVEVSTADNTFCGEVDVSSCRSKGVSARAVFNSEADGVLPYVESVQFTQQGEGWQISPTINVKEMNVGLEGVADMGSTATMFSVDHNGKSKFAIAQNVDSKTTLKVSSEDGFSDVAVGVDRKLGENDVVSPSFHAKGNHFKLDWMHRFGSTNLHTSLSQADKTVDMSVSSNNADWNVKLSTPWEAPQDSDISVSRKVSLSKFGPFRK